MDEASESGRLREGAMVAVVRPESDKIESAPM